MGVKHLNYMDTVTVELETDIILPIIFAHCPNLRSVTVNDFS